MKRLLPLLGISLTLVLVACEPTRTGDADTGSDSSSTVAGTEEESSSSTEAMEGEARTIRVTTENWKFTPNIIRVKKGEKVTLEVVGGEGIHGFAVPGLGINLAMQPGETKTITLDTSVAGEFEAFCSIPCGSGHKDMKATVIVE
ncbi:MAG: cupredoxin domain-containing protein [Candidatus Peregrinibacteria bacterium]|nr:cupredoxin domain-containing protein [Candidatus Peregrinibacteria bacterium]